MFYKMLHHVFGNSGNALLGFQQVASGAVFFLDRQQFFFATVLEQVFKPGFKAVLVVQRRIGSAAFIKNLQRGAVFHRIHQTIGIDIITKTLNGFLFAVAFGNQRRAGKGEAGGIREGFKDVVAKIRALGAMRFVDHQHDARRVIDHAKSLAGGDGLIGAQRFGDFQRQALVVQLKLVHHHHVDVGAVRGQLFAQHLAAVDAMYPAADQGGGFGELIFQVHPVVN